MSRREALATADRVRARLAERGTAVDDPASALDALERSWGREPDVEAAAVAWLGAAGGADAGARLQALAPRTESKAVKTEIRRALYRLEQRGLWSPPSAAPPPSARHLLGPADDEPEAWLSEIDPTGTRLLWMARRAGDGVASLSAVVNDVAGILEFHAGETTRKALRQAHRDLASRSKIALVEAPWRHVDALLAEAHEKSDQERFADVTRARRVIAPERAPGDIPAPVDSLLDRAAVAADADALRASAEALRARGAGSGWLLPAEWLTPVVEAVDAARTSLVVVSPAQQEERAREALEHGLADALAAPERRRLLARRFEETAYLDAKRGDVRRARALLAAAIATDAGRPLAEVPALAHLAQLSARFALEARAEKAQEEARSSLIVTPAQALAEQRARARRR
ncbi:MAG TPA: hypothetical protein VFB01_18970 [Burkholderiales bacterium]|nr:hypothetical protein [Burkholderiales bacterium]